MMVLIAYDVETQTEDGKRRLRHVPKCVRITVSGSSIPFLNACWIPRSGSSSAQNYWA